MQQSKLTRRNLLAAATIATSLDLGAQTKLSAVRYIRFQIGSKIAYGELDGDTVRELPGSYLKFDKPKGGRIAVKVINHLGDEVMKVFKV